MHNIMRYVILTVIALFLCGCASGTDAKIDFTHSSYQTNLADVSVQGFEVSKIADKEFMAQINSEVASDIDGAMVSFDTMVSESREDLRMGNKCVLEITQEVKTNERGILSVVEEHYVYTGGAHGSYMLYPRNYDFNQSKRIYLSDLFADDGYKEALNRLISELVTENAEEYDELWEKPQIADSHEYDFYFEGDKLVIFFQPYTLSYFAKGYITFPIKLSDLSGYMKEEYRVN